MRIGVHRVTSFNVLVCKDPVSKQVTYEALGVGLHGVFWANSAAQHIPVLLACDSDGLSRWGEGGHIASLGICMVPSDGKDLT